jgi:hypothetical protein
MSTGRYRRTTGAAVMSEVAARLDTAPPGEAARYADHVRRRFVAKPWLTGLWRVNRRSDRPGTNRSGSTRGVWKLVVRTGPADSVEDVLGARRGAGSY